MAFTRGNTKLGAWILSWAMTALRTCPGKSTACSKECYGDKFRYKQENVVNALVNNEEQARSENFVEWACAQITYFPYRVVRWHAVGDFFISESLQPPDQYVRDTIEVVKRFPDRHFYAYTRSWRVPELRRALIELSWLPNFTLWLSTDNSMSQPPKWKYTYTAYMAVSDDDVPRYAVDLVFRAGSKKKPMKRDAAGNQVCPYEQGIKRQVPITCSSCGICFEQADITPIVHSIGRKALAKV